MPGFKIDCSYGVQVWLIVQEDMLTHAAAGLAAAWVTGGVKSSARSFPAGLPAAEFPMPLNENTQI